MGACLGVCGEVERAQRLEVEIGGGLRGLVRAGADEGGEWQTMLKKGVGERGVALGEGLAAEVHFAEGVVAVSIDARDPNHELGRKCLESLSERTEQAWLVNVVFGVAWQADVHIAASGLVGAETMERVVVDGGIFREIRTEFVAGARAGVEEKDAQFRLGLVELFDGVGDVVKDGKLLSLLEGGVGLSAGDAGGAAFFERAEAGEVSGLGGSGAVGEKVAVIWEL